ncbi:helix-turn-helix transcriptional regulator [Bradyrhizobium elkanii]|uniref:Transcriptional regulator with XRE-family HTH domain n=1 Tax=Bradyrhizobium elkanii TaxID=29448 RepID=A0A8I1YH10_BRAEL|nr:helix-turn-helix transcriptional regulator [Bradyrhizobium elkanii]MBP1299785.1 transcriptional regulator with XRE-family HTH domain [Bradyrhizobium elkanii]
MDRQKPLDPFMHHMAKTKHPRSAYATEAAIRLGQLIREGRIERHMTVAALAERAGVSRGLMQRIEAGDAGCAIGSVFEAAAIVGVHLFDAGQATMSREVETHRQKLALLPKAIRSRRAEPNDDF